MTGSGGLLAKAAGDALGFEAKFMFEEDIFEIFGENGITEYVIHNGVVEIPDDNRRKSLTKL